MALIRLHLYANDIIISAKPFSNLSIFSPNKPECINYFIILISQQNHQIKFNYIDKVSWI